MAESLTDLPDGVRAFLAEKRFAVLATVQPDGVPHQTVMWYDLRGDQIMMNTRAGRVKHDHLERTPQVSICVADGYRFVTLRGHISLDYDTAIAQADIRALAVRYHGPEKGNRMAEERFSKQRRITIRMTVDHVIQYGFDE